VNPFKRDEKVEIPEQRSLSSLGFVANKTQKVKIDPIQSDQDP
jgi:hypothetical protein